MRRAAHVDGNHAEVVRALRAVGCSVQSLAPVGSGCPDLLVGIGGRNVVLEVKDGRKTPGNRKLKPAQVEWIREWRGQVDVVLSAEDAVRIVTGSDRG